jgi:uncharacterized membrane protein
MTLEPLLSAPFVIQFHVATVVPAAVLGAFLLLRRKGTRMHRLLGRVWIGLMVATALSTFFIHTINQFHGFSLIHLLSIATLSGCYHAVTAARRGDIRSHRLAIRAVYVGGIVLAGGFTLLPGRIMHAVIFSGGIGGALWLIGLLVALAIAVRLLGGNFSASGKHHA